MNKEKLYLTAYAEKMSKFLKWNEESFAEAWNKSKRFWKSPFTHIL